MKLKLIVLISILSTSNSREPPISVGGHFAQPGKVPYQVSIQERFGNVISPIHYCGGAIIDKKWVLTSGHCAAEIGKTSRINDFIIAAGKLLSFFFEPNQQIRMIDNIYIHEKYTHLPVRLISPYDIGLIKLNQSLKFNKYVAPIALPTKNEKLSTAGVVSGWNLIHNRDMNRYALLPWLKTGSLSILNNKTCLSTVTKISEENDNPLSEKTIQENIFCAGPLVSATTVCIGDSGGPFVKKKRFGKKVIIGILSYIENLYNAQGDSYLEGVSVFIKVAPNVNWIKATINTH